MPKKAGVYCHSLDNPDFDHVVEPLESPLSLEEDLAFYKFMIDSVPIAIVSMDSSFRITKFNHWAEKVTGYHSADAVGRHCADILRSGMCKNSCPLRAVLDQVKSTVSGRTTIHDKDGKVVPVRFNTAALFDAGGKLIGGVEAFMDISNLVAMERERANFISMLAHDMRSPLTGIHGLGLRLLRKLDELDRVDKIRYLEIITREAANVESLIDDFLDFSRIETGSLKLNMRAASLDKELEELFETYKIMAAQQGIRLELRVEHILPVIEADTDRLRRVFTNLLDNAIKFSRKNGTVTVTAQEKDREIMVMVTDEGVGIDSEDLPHIFDVFHRGRTSGGEKGHGLGLATVKAIVEGHGGRVIAVSQPNEGATFTVFLPKREAGLSNATTHFSSADRTEEKG
jgi:two-component system phosphate regulon sensor histidine kinase PhoR